MTNRRTDIVRLSLRAIALAVLSAVALGYDVKPALADFRMCNNTASRVGVALGYKDTEGWITEGWWNIPPRSCDTLLRGPLVARFYYLYAVDYDRGGEWAGKAFMCSRDKEFTIRGIENCLARGYDRTGYFEVDTREQRSWTVQLTESAGPTPDSPALSRGPGTPPPAAPANRQGGQQR